MESSSQKSSVRSQRSSAPTQRSSAQRSFSQSQKSSVQSQGSISKSQKSSVQSQKSSFQSQKSSTQSQVSFDLSQKSSAQSQNYSVAPSQRSSALNNGSAATMSGVSLFESGGGLREDHRRETPQNDNISLTEMSQSEAEHYEEGEQDNEPSESSIFRNGSVQNEEDESQMGSSDRYEPDAWDTALKEEEQSDENDTGINQETANNNYKGLYEDSQTNLDHYGTGSYQEEVKLDQNEAEIGLNDAAESDHQDKAEFHQDKTENYQHEEEDIDNADSEIDILYSAVTSQVQMANGQDQILSDSESEDYSDYDGEDPGGASDRALVSSTTLGGGGQAPQEGVSESALTRGEKLIILRRLMKEVTLEDTLAKYRGLVPVNAYVESQTKSDTFPSSQVPVKKKHPGMENDIVFLADREYMAKLESQLEKQYQNEMDKKEEERADLEKQRMRRLMVEGIIGPDEFKDDGHPKGRSHNSRSHRGSKKSRRSGSAWRSKSAPENKTRHQTPGPSNHRSQTAAPGAHASTSRKGSPTKQHTPRHTESSFNGESQMSHMDRDEDGNPRFQSRQTRFRRCFVHDEEGCTCDSKSPERKEPFIKHYQDPLIEKLKDDDMTVERMYTLADIILPTDRPKSYMEKPPNGKKKMTAEQERKRREKALAGVVRR